MRESQNPAAALLGAAGLVAILTLISRVFGFLRWLAQASWVGAGEVGNAYASANQIPNVIFEVVVGGALASVTVPLLAKAVAAERAEEINRIASALFTWTLTILLPLGLLLFLLADPIAAVLPESRGSNGVAQNALMAQFLRIFAAQIPLYGIAVVAGGVLQAQHRFAWPALIPAFSSLVTIGAYWLYDAWSVSNPFDERAISALGWGTTLGVVALSLPLLVPLTRVGVRLRLTWKMPREKFLKALELGGFGIGALVAAQGYMLVALGLARWGGEVGTINVFQYAQAIYMLPYALFTFPIATVVFPLLTREKATGERGHFSSLSSASTALVAALAVLGIAGLFAVASGMAAIFSWNRPIPGLELAIVAMSPALFGYALLYHLSRVFIALDRAVHTFVAALIGWGISALSAWILILVLAPERGNGPVTLAALGFGQAIGMSLAGLYLLVRWRIQQGGGLKTVLLPLVVTIPLAALGGAAGRLAYGAVVTTGVSGAPLWGTLLAGVVVVAVCLPAIYFSSTNFREVVREARRGNDNKEQGGVRENLDDSGKS